VTVPQPGSVYRPVHVTLASFASYSGLCLVQGAVVVLPRVPRARWLARLRARWLLLVLPAAAATGATFLPSVAALLATSLSTLALALVPPLAALGIAWALRWHDWRLLPLVPALLALGWSIPGTRLGNAAVLVLVVLSALALASLVAAVVPAVVAKVGIVAWAAADLSLALTHSLEPAHRALTGAAPPVAPHLQLQRVVLGSASMEYADLFVAAVLGALLAAQGRRQGTASLLVAALAIGLAGFLLVTNVLPATVPVAAALGLEELRFRRQGRTRKAAVKRGSAFSSQASELAPVRRS
jgi:hypothetical protein